MPQNQTDIGQAYVGYTANYGQVTAANGAPYQPIRNQLYILPNTNGTSGPNTVVSNTNFGSVTGTVLAGKGPVLLVMDNGSIGSARIIDMGLHITF